MLLIKKTDSIIRIDPESSRGIFQYSIAAIVGYSLMLPMLMLKSIKRVAIKPIEPLICRYPYKAFAIFVYTSTYF
jgi:hypothetical protein